MHLLHLNTAAPRVFFSNHNLKYCVDQSHIVFGSVCSCLAWKVSSQNIGFEPNQLRCFGNSVGAPLALSPILSNKVDLGLNGQNHSYNYNVGMPIYVHHRVGVHVYANTHVVWDALYRLLWEHQFSQP